MYAAVSIPVVKEAYKRIGIPVTISIRPAKRALAESSAGVTDGEVNRIAKTAKLHPSLLPVGPPIIALRGVAFVIGKKFTIGNWEDLRPYRIGVVRGIVFSDKPTQGMNRFQAKDPRHLFKLLVFDRIDVAITSALNGRFIIGKYFPGKKIRALDPPLIDIDTFHFLHEKHRDLIPVVAKSLDDMKKSGRIEEIIGNAIRNMISAEKEKPQN